MAVNFPSNPTNGQTITVSGITYAYDSTQGVWSDSPQGLTQAIDALTDVDTSTVAPTNGQVLQWNSTDSEWQPADSSAGVTVYATIDDLPLSGVAEGSMALVDSTDKLYIFSDAGWYSITLVNTTPSISGVNATYTLASDGTATVVTVTATDPEGIPLTYSIVSDTSGNIATVTQGTGANTNQWTITPSTNTANAGNFTLVFRASDGVNVASASSTFELQFSVVNSNYTTALITAADNGYTSNKVFRDSSGNNHTITANGDATQSTFSPYRHGGYSTYFDGTGDYISAPNQALGSQDYSYEFWINHEASGTKVVLDWSGSPQIYTIDTTLYLYVDSANRISTTVSANQWNHIAIVRSSGVTTLYNNGVAESTTYTDSNNYTNSTMTIGGRASNSANTINGYVVDVRVVKGTAVYTSAFTPPTERLTAITNTSLLTCHLPYIADGSTNSHSITVNGNTKTEPFGPYDYQEYSASANGGSAYFDGSGDYLTVSNSSGNFSFGTGNFTVETWVYYEAMPAGSGYPNSAWILGGGALNSNAGVDITVGSTNIQIGLSYFASLNIDTAHGMSAGNWYHLAVVRNGNTLTCYKNGVSLATADVTGITANAMTSGIAIGAAEPSGSTSGNPNGYYSDFRIVKGTAVYTSAFTPPTAPLTAITNTSLLLPFDDATIIDKSQTSKTLTLAGNTTISATQTKYLNYSMYFDGTGDYITLSDSDAREFGGEDFTIELWVKTTIATQNATLISRTPTAFSSGMWTIFMNATASGGQVAVYVGDYSTASSLITTSGASIRDDSWHHVAVVRNGSSFVCYIDGTSRGTGSWAGSIANIAGDIRIGADQNYGRNWEGYMSDLRITKGLARYTSNFTPPSAALEG